MPDNQLEYLICGAFGGICTVLVGHPLDTVKVRLQTMPKPAPGQPPLYTGTLDCIKKTIAKEGFFGLYKGIGAPLVSMPPIFAISFMGYGLGKLMFASPNGKLTMTQDFLSGGVAGFFSTMFMAPGERIKCLLQVQESSVSGQEKVDAIHKALDHFDDFYKDVFGVKWQSIRTGLLSKQKYVAVINNYGNVDETVAELEKLGALNMRTLFNLEKTYIEESLAKKKRVQYLEKIWTSEENVSPEISTIEREDDSVHVSLEKSLANADIDSSRLIDENTMLSAPILSQFLPATKIKGKEDWVLESDHFKRFDKNLSANIEKEYEMHFPEHLNVYCFEQNNYSKFEGPQTGATGVYNYYLMDGGSVLPVLALDIKPGDHILDMCAAPGGKSFLALQTLYPNYLVCNDSSLSRVNRILNVLEQYFYDLDKRWIKANRLKVTQRDGRLIQKENYSRVLVDVPCTTDRLSVMENDNNIFKPGRIKERLKLPELQSELLLSAMKLVKKGGVVVYSTCSLSPIQNDGVVSMALKKIWEETNLEFIVKDLSPALAQVQSVYRLADASLMKYGQLVIPFKEQNYGPTYFCKLQRVK